jgi:RNA-directed DNA polymerase
MPGKLRTETYDIERSPFYHIGRQRDLALLLHLDLKTIKRLVRNRHSQYWRKDLQIGGKSRSIVCPFGLMREVHERLQALFNRIKQPHYLQSPRRGRSAAGNAEIHSLSNVIAKLDIRQFYPSTTDEHVYRFFHYRMEMPDDVAGLATKLCTVDGRLPFGSPLSPILCTLVHRDLFDQIDLHCRSRLLKMSLWVDDITLSGDAIPDRVIWTIKQIINAKGLRYHKVQVRVRNLGAIVTGHYLHRGGVAAANKHHLGVRDSLAGLDSTADPTARLKLVRSLIGKTNYARGIYVPHTAVRDRLDRRRDWLHAERRHLEREAFTTHPSEPPKIFGQGDTGLPWVGPAGDLHAQYLADLSEMANRQAS